RGLGSPYLPHCVTPARGGQACQPKHVTTARHPRCRASGSNAGHSANHTNPTILTTPWFAISCADRPRWDLPSSISSLSPKNSSFPEVRDMKLYLERSSPRADRVPGRAGQVKGLLGGRPSPATLFPPPGGRPRFPMVCRSGSRRDVGRLRRGEKG